MILRPDRRCFYLHALKGQKLIAQGIALGFVFISLCAL